MALINIPVVFAALCFGAMWLAAHAGIRLRRRRPKASSAERNELDVIVAAALTLLGLLIAFTLTMAVTRYDQREKYEAEEANAIDTAYARASLLPEADAAAVRTLLRRYLEQRIEFYSVMDDRRLAEIGASTTQLQNELWSDVQHAAVVDRTAVTALVVSGMDDVLSAQRYAQAAWWNRIPTAAWTLMVVIGISANLLVGYKMRDPHTRAHIFFIFPALVAISFFLIAEIENPRHGVIRVHPVNLVGLSQSVRAT